MKGYILSVMCISIVASLMSLLSPDGEGGGIGKNLRLVLGICVVIVCINPIKDVVNWVNEVDIGSIVDAQRPEKDEYEEMFENSYGAAEAENLKSGIKRLLCDKFGMESHECDVKVSLYEGGGEMRELKTIYITLYGAAVFKNSEDMESYLSSLFKCETVTIIG